MLGGFRERCFRAGHAHAGVLLIFSLGEHGWKSLGTVMTRGGALLLAAALVMLAVGLLTSG